MIRLTGAAQERDFLSRIVEEPGIIADIALRALQVMHFDIGGDKGLPATHADLTDATPIVFGPNWIADQSST